MHPSSMLRMQWFVEQYAPQRSDSRVRVLDVGSYDVNGSYRELFDEKKFEYTGMDMAPGPNVDLVMKTPYDWSWLETDSVDCVISGQAFEHIEFFWVTMAEMTRVLKPDGVLCLIAPNGFGEHRYPVDCYRFFTDGMVALARYCQLEILHAHTNCGPSAKDRDWFSEKAADAMLIARKPYSGATRHPDFTKYECDPVDQASVCDGLVPYQKKKGLNRLLQRLESRIYRLRSRRRKPWKRAA